MHEISNTDKINVYVPENIGAVLKSDAEHFEILKKNGKDINMNRFLSLLLIGYYEGYKQEQNETASAIRDVVGRYIENSAVQRGLTERLMEEIVLPTVPKRKGRNPVRLPLKPTYETDQCITEIIQSLGPNDYISQYLCRMFMSYCEKPIYERERILFREQTEFLQRACREKRSVSFAYSMRPDYIHHVLPYKLVYGADERFNYLLCQEYNERDAKMEARSYRLCRINRPSFCAAIGLPEESVIRFLEEMERSNPQYAMNEFTETCVRFSKEGRNGFRMIYQNRPSVVRYGEVQSDGSALYYFNAPLIQMFLYLRRFNAGEALVQYPEKLRRMLVRFFSDSLKAYECEENTDDR